MTLSNGGLWDALVLLHEQHGGRWQENYENQYCNGGEVLHQRRRIQMVFELQNGYLCKRPIFGFLLFLDYFLEKKVLLMNIPLQACSQK